MNKIDWFKTSVGEQEVESIRKAVLSGRVSMGSITQELESNLSKALGVRYCLITPSGSVALFLALKAHSIGPGDEVIVPNRGWVAAAHAVILTGAKVVLSDCLPDLPIIDAKDVQVKITSKTKAIIPLHLNGRSADMRALKKLTRGKGIIIVDDACQALFSKNEDGFIGTQGNIGCFSLGMAKLMATGQGGFVVTSNEKIYHRLKMLRSHGVVDNFTDSWNQWGFNFKFTDIQAAMGLAQLKRVPQRIKHLKAIYNIYQKGLTGLNGIRLIPVDIKSGEIPLYIEVLADGRDALIKYLGEKGIQVRPSTPDLDLTSNFKTNGEFPNSRIFSKKGIYLPSGPEQPLVNIRIVMAELKSFYNEVG